METGTESNATRQVSVAWDGAVQTVAERAVAMKPPQSSTADRQPRFWTDCLLPANRRRWQEEESLQVMRDYLDASFPGDTLASPYSCPSPACTTSSSSQNTEIDSFESPSYLATFAQVPLLVFCQFYKPILVPANVSYFKRPSIFLNMAMIIMLIASPFIQALSNKMNEKCV